MVRHLPGENARSMQARAAAITCELEKAQAEIDQLEVDPADSSSMAAFRENKTEIERQAIRRGLQSLPGGKR